MVLLSWSGKNKDFHEWLRKLMVREWRIRNV